MPLLMSAFTPKANIGPQSLHVRSGSKADMCDAQADVCFVPIADIVEASAQCPLCPNKQTLRGLVGLSGKGTS